MTEPSRLLVVSPEVQAIFDALLAFMGTEYVNANSSATLDPSGATTCTINATDQKGDTYTYTQRINAAPAPGAAAPHPGTAPMIPAPPPHG